MTYVENKRKDLQTDYTDDTPEVGKNMHLKPVDGTLVLRRNRAGIK